MVQVGSLEVPLALTQQIERWGIHKAHIKLAFANAKIHLELPCSREDVEIWSSSQFPPNFILALCQLFNTKAQELEAAVTQN